MHRTFFKNQISLGDYKKQTDKKSKYNSKRKSYKGKSYHSTLEANYAALLDLRIKAKEIKSWTSQFKISFDVNNVHITNYYMDFRVITSDNKIEYHEVKGFEKPEWIIKWNLLKATLHEQENGKVFAMVLIKYGKKGWIIKREKENHF